MCLDFLNLWFHSCTTKPVHTSIWVMVESSNCRKCQKCTDFTQNSNKKLKAGQSSSSGLSLSQTSMKHFDFLILSNLNCRRSKTACYAFLHHRYLSPMIRREASIVCIQGRATLCGIAQSQTIGSSCFRKILRETLNSIRKGTTGF